MSQESRPKEQKLREPGEACSVLAPPHPRGKGLALGPLMPEYRRPSAAPIVGPEGSKDLEPKFSPRRKVPQKKRDRESGVPSMFTGLLLQGMEGKTGSRKGRLCRRRQQPVRESRAQDPALMLTALSSGLHSLIFPVGKGSSSQKVVGMIKCNINECL